MRFIRRKAHGSSRPDKIARPSRAAAGRTVAFCALFLAVVALAVHLWLVNGSAIADPSSAQDARAVIADTDEPEIDTLARDISSREPAPAAHMQPDIATATPAPTTAPTVVPPVAALPRDSSQENESAARAKEKLSHLTVALDPGHGGPDSGALYHRPDGSTLKEKDVALQVSLKLAEILRGAGLRVVMTRQKDTSVSATRASEAAELQSRVDVANAAGADIFVSIHLNASDKPTAQGTEVLYNPSRPFSAANRRLASLIHDSLISGIRAMGYPVVDRGLKTDESLLQGGQLYLLGNMGYIVRPSRMPAALGEMLFITNPTEAALVQDPAFIDSIAQDYAQGILSYFD